jgi:hypothetical protein
VGAFPLDSDQFNKMADSIEKLALNDRSLSVQRESSTALGQGTANGNSTDSRLSDGVFGVSSCWYHRRQIASGIWLRST